MGQLLKSGEVGNIGNNHLKLIREETIKKWDKLGFLEGLNGYAKDNIAQLFENQASYLINEATTTDSTGSFETVVFPMIRRVFSKLLANDIVSVQALNMPIGRLYYFKPKISTRQSDANNSHYNPDYYPNTGTTVNFETRSLYDAYYQDQEDALFDRSKGSYTVVTGATSQVTLSNGEMTSTTYSGSNVNRIVLQVSGFTSAGAGKLISPNGNEMDTEEFLASLKVVSVATITGGTTSAPITIYSAGDTCEWRTVTQRYGKGLVEYGTRVGSTLNICDATGKIYLEIDTTAPTTVSSTSLTGYIGANLAGTETFTITWRQYADLEFASEIGEVTFDIEHVTVDVTERKLRATWSPEMAQDVSAFHNIDAEAELTSILSEQIAAEIDREILRDIKNGAAWSLRWDWNGWRRLTTANSYTQKEWNQTLIMKINQISAQIHKATLRGGANWIVVSSEISAIFDDLEYFHVSNAAPEQDQYNMGIERIGTLNGRLTVYRDPYLNANTILIGNKGKSILDSGYIYAPYIPMQLTPTIYNPSTFAPVKGIMTRYAKKMVNNRYFGKVRVDGLQTFDINELR